MKPCHATLSSRGSQGNRGYLTLGKLRVVTGRTHPDCQVCTPVMEQGMDKERALHLGCNTMHELLCTPHLLGCMVALHLPPGVIQLISSMPMHFIAKLLSM
jgi:hypothetical protein